MGSHRQEQGGTELPAYFCVECLSITSMTFSKTHHFRETEATHTIKSVDKLTHQTLPNSLCCFSSLIRGTKYQMLLRACSVDTAVNIWKLRLVESTASGETKSGDNERGSHTKGWDKQQMFISSEIKRQIQLFILLFESTSFQRIQCTWNIFRRFGTKSLCNLHFTAENQHTVFKFLASLNRLRTGNWRMLNNLCIRWKI